MESWIHGPPRGTLAALLKTNKLVLPPHFEARDALGLIRYSTSHARSLLRHRELLSLYSRYQDPEEMPEETFLDIMGMLIESGISQSGVSKHRDAMAFFQRDRLPFNEPHRRWTEDEGFRIRFRGLLAWAAFADGRPSRGPIDQHRLEQLVSLCEERDLAMYGAGFVLAYDTMLRHGEFSTLKRAQILKSGDRVSTIHIVGIKGHRQPGRKPFHIFVKPDISATLLGSWLDSTDSETWLFPGWDQRLANRLIADAAAAFEWPKHFNYSVHSLRHGRALDLKAKGIDPQEIMLRGRWASRRTMEHYAAAEDPRTHVSFAEAEE